MSTSVVATNLTPEEKRNLLGKLLAERAGRAKVRRVSYSQSRLWFLDQLQPGEGVYNIPIPIPLNGFVDIDALRRSVNEIIRRHEALRTTIRLVDGEPAQVIAPALEIDIPLIDLSSTEAPATQANSLAFQEGRRPFDLAKGPLIRATILRLGSASHILLVVMHHIVSDGWSVDVFLREVSTLYAALALNQASPLPELPIQYADYAKWQAEWLSGDMLERQLAYWRSALAGLKPRLELPLDRPRPPMQTHRGATEQFEIERTLLTALTGLGQREGATLFMTLLAAFQTLLYRYTCETDFAVGSPVANRPRPEMAGLIGFFVNTIVLRATLTPRMTFREFLQRVRQTTLEAYEYQDLPFEKLVEELRPARDTSHNPLFQVMLTVHHAGARSTAGPAGALISNGTAKFDLTAVIVETGKSAQGFLEYNSDLLSRQTVIVMIERFLTLLGSIVQNPDTDLRSLRLAPEAEAETGEPRVGGVVPIPSLVATHASERPHAIAFACGEVETTWAQFDRAAQRHATYLVSRGIRRGDRVAVVLERSMQSAAEQAAMIVGAQRLGAIPVLIDAGEPPRRLESMLSDAGAALTATVAIAAPTDADADAIAPIDAFDDDVACIVYRSGPHGRPVGVPLSHRRLVRSALAGAIRIEPSDRVAWHSCVALDACLNELFGSLGVGATIAGFDPRHTPLQFARALRDREITVLFVGSDLLKRLGEEFPWSLRRIRLIFTVGESLAGIGDLCAALGPGILPRVFALWGWTEAGGACAFLPLADLSDPAPRVPIGFSLLGPDLDVLDDDGKLVPTGIVGEITIDGRRSGNFAVRRSDGYLDSHGRRDGRVAIGGVRAEAAEVEAALARHEGIATAAVVDRPDGQAGLVAFVVPRNSNSPSRMEVQRFLAQWLPPELIPASIHTVKEIALTGDGAIDRLALRAGLVGGRSGAAEVGYVAPRNPTEEQMAWLWAQTLRQERIGVHDNFFSRGGHSLSATQLVARMRDHFGIDIPLRRLFEKPTIAEMAADLAIEDPLRTVAADRAISPVPRDRPIPLSFAQQRLWFLDRYEPNSAFYNMPNATRMRGPVDVDALRDGINALIRRHESLRTTFAANGGEPSQVVHQSLVLEVPVRDLRGLPPLAREAEAQRIADEHAQCAFDLAAGPLIRAEILKLAEEDHILLVTLHHIIADGWSMDVLYRELGAAYSALSMGQDPVLPDLSVQYADFACWQREWLAGPVLMSQLEYWKRQLAGAPPVLELPTDRPRPRIQMFRGGMHTFRLPLSLLMRLRALCESEQITLFMVLLGGFKALLYRYTGQTDLVVGTPVANRVRPELESVVGFFANTLVLRTRLSAEMSFRELLREIRKTALDAYANQDMPFERLVEELAPERNLAYNPLFQVMFALQNIGRVAIAGGAANAGAPALGTGIAKFDLTVFLSETSNGIEAGFEYNSGLFDSETLERMSEHYALLLSAAADDADRSVATLPMLSRREILDLETSSTVAAPIAESTIEKMFEAQAALVPDALAVTAGTAAEGLTYRELNEIANAWAHRLRSFGVAPDVCVGIYMGRSPAMIAAVLAVLKAGGAYLPLDPKYPAARIAFMIEDARAPVILSERALASEIAAADARIILFDADDVPNPRPDAPPVPTSLEHLAYVIYTSGSTGRPKGVAMPRRPLANLLQWQNGRSNLPPGAGTLQFASLSFDVSFQEIFSTLTGGGTLHLLSEDERIDPDAVWDRIEHGSIRRAFMPFPALQQLAQAVTRRPRVASCLREVITAGEQLKITPAIVRFAERVGFDLYNQYGPTESHVVTEFKLEGAPSTWPGLPPIGKPIANASIHILDTKRQPVPIGVAGEIHIGGVPLARGYLNRPDMTAARFLTGFASSADERLYQTGDRGRYRNDGTVEFLGRADTQLKIRGFRVEPEEVERTLQRHPAVRAAAAVAGTDGAGGLRLIAYVEWHPDQKADMQELRRHLQAWLPDHMIPTLIAVVEKIPLTPSGKLDRKALPDAASLSVDRNAPFEPPRTPVEQTLVNIWQELLQVERVGIHDNFFELGGHSLLATRVMSRIRGEFDVELPVRQIFETPTIGELAVSIVHWLVEQDEDMEAVLSEIENSTPL